MIGRETHLCEHYFVEVDIKHNWSVDSLLWQGCLKWFSTVLHILYHTYEIQVCCMTAVAFSEC